MGPIRRAIPLSSTVRMAHPLRISIMNVLNTQTKSMSPYPRYRETVIFPAPFYVLFLRFFRSSSNRRPSSRQERFSTSSNHPAPDHISSGVTLSATPSTPVAAPSSPLTPPSARPPFKHLDPWEESACGKLGKGQLPDFNWFLINDYR